MSKRKALWLILTLAAIVAGLLFFETYFYEIKAKSYLGGLYLANLGVDNKLFELDAGKIVSVDDQAVNVYEKRKIYALAAFYKEYKEDPLLADSTLDVDKFNEYIKNIDKAQGEIKKFLGTSEDIIPTRLLLGFTEASHKAAEFEKKPNVQTANDYISSADTVAKEYKRALDNAKVAANKYGTVGGTLIASGGYTSADIVSSDLDMMERNYLKLSEEIAFRKNVLAGVSVPISSADVKVQSTVENPPAVNLLPTEELAVPSFAAENLGDIYAVTTSCYDGKDSVKAFYGYYEEKNGHQLFLPKDVSNNYYLKLDGNQGWKLLREGNSYNCLDNEFQAKLLNLKQFVDNFKSPLLQESGDKNLTPMAEIESTFYNLNIKSDKSLDDLGLSYLAAYRELITKDRGQKTSELADQTLARYVFIMKKTSGLDSLYAADFSLDKFSDLLPHNSGSKENLQKFSYLIRPDYSITYFNFSSLFWRIAERPKYNEPIDLTKEGLTQRIFDYRSLIVGGVQKAELMSLNKALE